jgi:hypothetical protein
MGYGWDGGFTAVIPALAGIFVEDPSRRWGDGVVAGVTGYGWDGGFTSVIPAEAGIFNAVIPAEPGINFL